MKIKIRDEYGFKPWFVFTLFGLGVCGLVVLIFLVVGSPASEENPLSIQCHSGGQPVYDACVTNIYRSSGAWHLTTRDGMRAWITADCIVREDMCGQ